MCGLGVFAEYFAKYEIENASSCLILQNSEFMLTGLQAVLCSQWQNRALGTN